MAARRTLKTTALPAAEGSPAREDTSPESSVRLASTLDAPISSPVQTLTARLEQELGDTALPRRLPLAISAPIWLITSGLLWFGIIKGVLAILHH